jgi:hypothetical protein
MAKVKLRNSEKIRKFIKETSDVMIKAELDTLMETKLSDLECRIYMFTPFSVGIATTNFPENIRPIDVYKNVISEFKKRERDSLSDVGKNIYDENGGASPITALLSFLPSKAVKIHKDDMPSLEPELQAAITNNTMTPELMETFDNGKYKHKVQTVLQIQLDTFFENKVTIYEIVEHDDEALDVKLIHTLDLNGVEQKGYGALNHIHNLIEVEE